MVDVGGIYRHFLQYQLYSEYNFRSNLKPNSQTKFALHHQISPCVAKTNWLKKTPFNSFILLFDMCIKMFGGTISKTLPSHFRRTRNSPYTTEMAEDWR